MPNYFNDNQDLLFHFSKLNLTEVIKLLEQQYLVDKADPLRPESYLEAMANYQDSLELCGEICANVIAPLSQSIDHEGTSLSKGRVKYAEGTLVSQKYLAEAGFMGVIIPREFNGLNFPATIYIMMIEIVSRADASMMTLFGYQDVGEAIANLASQDVATKFLPDYCAGNKIGAMVLTEAGGGSDLQAITVQACQNSEGEWHLNGVKQFISHGNGDVLLVLARSEENSTGMFGLSLFVVEGGSNNKVSVNRIENKMGLHGSPTCEIEFSHSKAFLVGKQKFGLFHVIDILNHARFSVAAQALGIAQSAYNAALVYAQQRKAFGQYIYDMPPVANILMNIKVALASNRAMLYDGAQCLDLRNKLHEHINKIKLKGEKPSVEDRLALKKSQQKLDLVSPLVKYLVTESANQICYFSQQVFGGAGYIREYTVERCIRDVRITTIYEGTSQVQVGLAIKHVLADVLADEFALIDNAPLNDNLQAVLTVIQHNKAVFYQLTDIVNTSDDKFFQLASAKDLVDSYGNLYASYLLLKYAQTDISRVPVLLRQVKQAQAEIAAALSRLNNGFYTDGQNRDGICL